jgi:hypothetical protein
MLHKVAQGLNSETNRPDGTKSTGTRLAVDQIVRSDLKRDAR